MGQIIRCPLVGIACGRPIDINEKSFFLAEVEKPDEERKRRRTAITTVLGKKYTVRSALDEKGINAFTCKICEMIQSCAYGIVDITGNNPNVLFELGILIALGKPTIILVKKNQKLGLKLPSDLNAIEVVPFTEYIDTISQLKDIVKGLPPPPPISNPIKDLEKIQPQIADEFRRIARNKFDEFSKNIREAKIDILTTSENKLDLSPELSEKLNTLKDQIENIERLGINMDAETACFKGLYSHFLGNYKEALINFNVSLGIRNDADVLIRRAEIYWHLDKNKETISDCNQSLALKPNNFFAFAIRGNAYSVLKKPKRAISDYNRALKLVPNNPIALFNRAQTFLELGKINEAVDDLNDSIRIKPDFDALMMRGEIHYALNKYKQAINDIKEALLIKPDDPEALYALACLFSLQEKIPSALNHLKKAIYKNKEFKQEAKTDTDFDKIRNDPRFKKLIGED